MSTPSSVPDYKEIAATVARLEAAFDGREDVRARMLMEAYQQVSDRFTADLSDKRDLALSKGAALMLIQELISK
jgi:hypothetical protein